MTDLILSEKNLPANLNDLSKFVLIGNDKLQAVRAEISAIKKLGLAKEVHEQKLAEGQEIAEMVILAKIKMGELLNDLPKASGGNRGNQYTNGKIASPVDFGKKENPDEKIEIEEKNICDEKIEVEEPKVKPKSEVIKEIGFTQKQAEQLQQMAKNPEAVHAAIAKAKENGDIVSQSSVMKEIQAVKKAETIEKARADIAQQSKDSEIKAFLKVADGIGFKPKEKYNLLLTDPPYSTDVENIEEFAESWLPNALNYVTDDGSAYVFIGAYPNELRAYLNIQPPKHMQLIQVLVWTYKNTLGNNPKNHYKQNWQACLFYRGIKAPSLDCPLTAEQWAVQEINAPDGRLGDRFHAWQKPVEIAERFIRHTTKRGDTVFDPFACTGTFLLAAAKFGRNAYGFEIDSENAKIAFERGCVNGGNF